MGSTREYIRVLTLAIEIMDRLLNVDSSANYADALAYLNILDAGGAITVGDAADLRRCFMLWRNNISVFDELGV